MIAKAKLLIGKWMQETGQVEHDKIYQHYQEILQLQPKLNFVF